MPTDPDQSLAVEVGVGELAVIAVAAPALPAAAVDRLPRGELDVSELDEDRPTTAANQLSGSLGRTTV